MILVTGATGFVGSALVRRLASEIDAEPVVAAVRHQAASVATSNGIYYVPVGDINASTDWSRALTGVRAVIHCAARVHIMKDHAPDALEIYRETNVRGTVALARQAAAAGVKRFVFVSSIKVNGEYTQEGKPFSAESMANPKGPYGVSKWEAEQALHRLAEETGLEVCIVRAPLVYGPGVRANFKSMMKLLCRGWPLPFAGVTKNRRSLVALDNLVDLLALCAKHPNAANQVFMVSDGHDLSTAELLLGMGHALSQRVRLVPVPLRALQIAAAMVGQSEAARRLLGNLQADISKTRQVLGWVPPISVEEGLRRVALDFKNGGRACAE